MGNDREEKDRLLPGNAANTQKLVAKYVRDDENDLVLDIPFCIQSLLFAFTYNATNVKFAQWEDEISKFVSVSNGGKLVKISSRTVCIFSSVGYSTGSHIWHIQSHNKNNCLILGIAEHKKPECQSGANIYDDTALHNELGDRYIFLGDSGHSRRGGNSVKPYVCSVINGTEKYKKDLKIKDGDAKLRNGDIITIKLNFGSGKKREDTKRTIEFLKNGKAVCSPIPVVKNCAYYPIFQWYQRGTYEIIENEHIEYRK